MSFIVAVAILAVVTAVTCAIPGTFLVLRRVSMLADAMSHAVLPGIVVGAILSHSTHSPLMLVMASLMGLIVVVGAEYLRNTGMVKGDANQALIFPMLFAVGVILLSTTLSEVHICQDTVLTGDLNLMALEPERLVMGDWDLGPKSVWMLAGVCVVNVIYIVWTYPVLKISTFDPVFARSLGMPVQAVSTGFMFLVALTIVAAFNTAGAILVVALLIVPPATALLVTRTLPQMLVCTVIIAAGSAFLGFWVAYVFDLATSAMMAVVDALVFLVVLALRARRPRVRVAVAAAS